MQKARQIFMLNDMIQGELQSVRELLTPSETLTVIFLPRKVEPRTTIKAM